MKFLFLSFIYLASILVSADAADSSSLRGTMNQECFEKCVQPCFEGCMDLGDDENRLRNCFRYCNDSYTETCKAECMMQLDSK